MWHDVHCLTAAWKCAGGELQRFAIAVVAAQAADIYMIDEPSSYLDVRQRLKAAQVKNGFCSTQKQQASSAIAGFLVCLLSSKG